MKKYLIASAVIVALLMLAPAVSAGGKGGWGKGSLSETLLFYVDDSDVPAGYMYWSPETADFIFDFHGYELDIGTYYYLIAYEGEPGDEPASFLLLGWKVACVEYSGVHIKGAVPWPNLEDATLCLVPETYVGFGGTDGWVPDTYQLAGPIDLP